MFLKGWGQLYFMFAFLTMIPRKCTPCRYTTLKNIELPLIQRHGVESTLIQCLFHVCVQLAPYLKVA